MPQIFLKLPDGRELGVNPDNDLCVYQHPRKVPDAVTYIGGVDLYHHQTDGGQSYFYTRDWFQIASKSSTEYKLISSDSAESLLLSLKKKPDTAPSAEQLATARSLGLKIADDQFPVSYQMPTVRPPRNA